MTGRLRPLLVPTLVLAVVFALSGVVGYVYSHEPARDVLEVELTGTPAPTPTYVTGAVEAIDGGVLHLAVGAGGRREVRLPSDAPVEALERLEEPPADGVPVNVGVDDTDFGQVLTGIVVVDSIEGAP